jgi:CO/xanthine dehydrogenase Mo-binding subunit
MSATREPRNTIGKARRRVDARAKVTGQTRFADDIALPRTVHCKLLRSKVPHARLRSVDTSRAEKRPGVLLVLTGADFPITFGILPVSQDEDPLCRDRVRFVGDPIAAVIAMDEAAAFDALDAIDVDYEILPTRATPLEAYENPEPRIHEYGEEGNVHKRVSFQFGDTEEAFAASDRVFEDVFFFQGTRTCPSSSTRRSPAPDPDGKLTIWSSTQVPHYLASRARARLGAPAGATSGDRLPERRRLRRKDRSVQPRDRRREGGDDPRAAL